MPTINLKRIKPETVEYKHVDNSSKFYNSIAWKRLRHYYISNHPICMECIKHNRISDAEEVHHKRPFLTGKTEEEQWELFLDENNLMSLCRDCHDRLHLKAKRYKLNIIDDLTDEEYNENRCDLNA